MNQRSKIQSCLRTKKEKKAHGVEISLHQPLPAYFQIVKFKKKFIIFTQLTWYFIRFKLIFNTYNNIMSYNKLGNLNDLRFIFYF